MQDEENIIDVGEADYEETEVNLEAQQESKEESKEEIEVQQVEEQTTPVETKKEELDDYSDGVNKRIAKLTGVCEKQNVKKKKPFNMHKL